jgi:hypothetical protein
MAGKFSIRINMCDGKETLNFSNLGQVVRFIKGRDMGESYRRPGYLQAECGQYYFGGFDWNDLLDGSPYCGKTKYKAELLAEVPTVRFTERKDRWKSEFAVVETVWDAKDGPERIGSVDLNKPSTHPNADNSKLYQAWLGANCRKGNGRFATLAEAKKWLADAYAESVKPAPEPVLSAGYDDDGPDW